MVARSAFRLGFVRWLSALLLSWAGGAPGVAQTFALRQFGIDNGLPQSTLYAICQDRDGVLWAGTEGGLCGYDGQHFRTLTTADGLPDNHVTALAAAPNGTLWLGHTYGGLSWRRPGGPVRRCRLAGAGAGALAKVYCLLPQGPRTLWVGTWQGLFRLTCGPADTTVTRYGPAQGLPDTSVQDLAADPGGKVWVGTGTGLFVLDPSTSLAQAVPAIGRLPVLHFSFGGDSLVWVATTTGLVQLHGGGPAARPWQGRRIGPADGLCAAPVWRVLQDRTGRVWVATAAGISMRAAGSQRFRCLPGDDNMSTDQANGLVEDREGNIWFANDRGLAQHLGTEPFEQYGAAAGLPDPEVRAVAQVQPGRYWVGTHAGLVEFGPPTASGEREGRAVPLRPGQKNARIYALFGDRAGRAWVGSANGVARYDFAARRWTYYDDLPGVAGSTVFSIGEDRRGRVWVATSTRGLTVLDPATGAHQHFGLETPGLKTNDFWQVFRDRTGALWLASDDQGLVQVDTEHDTFTRRDGRPGPWSLGSVSEDGRGHLWLGSIGQGVWRYTLTTGQMRAFGANYGLRDSNPYFVQCDSAGHLWVGTNVGLDRLDVGRGQTTHYGVREGFMGQETNQNAVLLDRGGELWVGTIGGLMHYDPAHARPNRVPPQTLFTGLRVMFRDTTLRPGLSIPFRRNSLSLDYVGVCLTNPVGVRYQYRLVGFDTDWVGPLSATTATYTNLPPGNYTFEVKAANNDGVWNPRPSALAFTVRPPWWRTWWAYGAYALAFGLLLQAVRVTTRNRERERTDRELERQALSHLQELDRVKTDFFTNISHELRTPLTLILGPAEVLATAPADAAVRQQGSLVLRHARRLLTLINQLLDLSKLEAGALRLLPTTGDVAATVRHLVAAFSSLAESRGIALHCEAPAGPLPLVFDVPKLEEVVTNLVANALRFTPAGGQVRVRVAVTPPTAAAPQGGVAIAVQDTGPGIEAADLPHLFNRFYQAANLASGQQRTGTGIGLALVRELTELHGGTVSVQSAPGQGATFTVQLPQGLRPVAGVVPAASHQVVADLLPVAAPAAPQSADLDAELVLVVEDNDEIRAFIRATLEPAGYRLLEAADGLAGLALAQAEVPDLVVSDVMMPGLDGYQLCAQLKADPATSHIPVVLLTAKSAPDARLEGLETGADSFLAKPFDPRELRAQVRNLLALKQRVRERVAAALQPVAAVSALTEQAELNNPAGAMAEMPTPDPLAAHAAAVAELPSADQKFLTKLNDLILQHLEDEEFGVDELGREIGLSRTQLHRKLKALNGQSPGDCIRQTRLLRALALLQARIGTVAEVAYQVGFSSPNNFSTAFSRQFGYPPSAVAKGVG